METTTQHIDTSNPPSAMLKNTITYPRTGTYPLFGTSNTHELSQIVTPLDSNSGLACLNESVGGWTIDGKLLLPEVYRATGSVTPGLTRPTDHGMYLITTGWER